MYISGGIAGVSQQLQIHTNRYARYVDFHPQSRQVETALSVEAYGRLVALFVEKDFIHMRSTYLDTRLVDAFHYRLVFRYGGAEKEVETDYLSAPQELRILVDELLEVIDTLLNKSLVLEFKTSTDTLRPGEKLALTLIATNLATSELTLRFRDGQTYDFFVTMPVRLSGAFPPPYLWNWAYDKFFIQVIRSETLAAGESRAYSVEWDGRSNTGEMLVGEFLVGARLVSIPGGYASMQRVTLLR
jgi:hypothetical protein